MDRMKIWVFLLSVFLVFHASNSVEEDVKSSLVSFATQLSGDSSFLSKMGWNVSTDPCIDGWTGVSCVRSTSVKKVVLEGLNLTGTLDASSLCNVQSLQVLSLQDNDIGGGVAPEIGNCRQLTQLLLSGNKFSGTLPELLSGLNNLKRLDISNNNFSGELPNLARISGLVSFLAENNHLSGQIPKFDFDNLQLFNVSFNNFSGEVPDFKGHFTVSSIIGNTALCGGPLPNQCPQTPSSPKKKKSKSHSVEHILMYSGYVVIGLLVVGFIGFKLFNKNKTEVQKTDAAKPTKGAAVDVGGYKPISSPSTDYKTGASKEYSTTSAESAMMSSSMVVLSSPVVKGLRFEDLLKAPAELLGRGKHSTLYKVILDEGIVLAVKRIKDWAISSEDFKNRMQKINQVKHHSVMSAVAFYSSKQEKLLVYKYQQNGSLFKLIYGTQTGRTFDWTSRLCVAASVAEGLAFMHKELGGYGIPHGNLKSSNILFSQNMDPCISEYGLMVVDNQTNLPLANGNGYKTTNQTEDRAYKNFKVDLHGFGVILLELLTGKQVENGHELAQWVHSVLREEWTVEVFDKNLVRQGASEQGMVNLLQVALKCIDPSPEARPSMNEIAVMINSIKEEEESSMVSEV